MTWETAGLTLKLEDAGPTGTQSASHVDKWLVLQDGLCTGLHQTCQKSHQQQGVTPEIDDLTLVCHPGSKN